MVIIWYPFKLRTWWIFFASNCLHIKNTLIWTRNSRFWIKEQKKVLKSNDMFCGMIICLSRCIALFLLWWLEGFLLNFICKQLQDSACEKKNVMDEYSGLAAQNLLWSLYIPHTVCDSLPIFICDSLCKRRAERPILEYKYATLR